MDLTRPMIASLRRVYEACLTINRTRIFIAVLGYR